MDSSSLLQQDIRGGLLLVGGVKLGACVEPVYNAVNIVELAVENGATAVAMLVASRKQLGDLSDDMVTKVDVQFYSDVRDVLLKAIAE